MRAKTMEGLIRARTNMELMNTPFRVFKEARRKGDVAKMKRAMGYMNECQEDANEYKAIADDGMKEDAEDTRKIAEKQRCRRYGNRWHESRRRDKQETKSGFRACILFKCGDCGAVGRYGGEGFCIHIKYYVERFTGKKRHILCRFFIS